MKQALLTSKESVLQMPHKQISEDTVVFDLATDEYFVENIPHLNDIDFHLEDRATCETDFSKLQLIPYITIVSKEDNRFFTYKRGTSGDEGRLHNLYSIGLGGHIEDEPGDGKTLFDVVTNNVLNELNEEAGIESTEELKQLILNKLLNKDFLLFFSTKNPVEEVHLALWMCIELEDEDLKDFEENNINEPMWYSSVEFDEMLNKTGSKLEHWTFVCYQQLKEKYKV